MKSRAEAEKHGGWGSDGATESLLRELLLAHLAKSVHCDKLGSQSWTEEEVSHESRGLKNKIGRSDKVVGPPRTLQSVGLGLDGNWILRRS